MIVTTCHQCSAPVRRGGNVQRARHFCSVDCKAKWQRTQKPVTEEWLRDAYIVQKLDCTQISKIVKRDSKSVWNWLKEFGIETRKRGTTGNHVHSIGVPRVLSDAGRKSLSEKGKAERARDGRRPYLKDGKHWLHHEGAVSPTWKGGITPERQAVYASQEWKDAVKAVWARDGFACVRCAVDLRRASGVCAIHHVESFANKDLRTEPTNLVLLCKPCHLWVHSRKNVNKEFIKESTHECV